MMEALPNLHAAVLHIPIVLLPMAVLLEVLTIVSRKRELDIAATATWIAASVGAGVAYVAGRSAADGLVGLDPHAQAAVTRHADAAWLVVAGAAPLSLFRLGMARASTPTTRRGWVGRIVVATVGMAVAIQLTIAADLGGALVYRHAVAVSLPEPNVQGVPNESRTSTPVTAEGRPPLRADATGVVWRPRAGDITEGVVSWSGDLEEAPPSGMVFEVDGNATIRFPATPGDVQVDATMDLGDFDGTVRIVHHLDSATGQAGALVIEESKLSLTGESRVLDRRDARRPSRATWSVSAAGSHLKGMVDGAVVVHGHEPARQGDTVALRFDGRGRVEIVRVVVTRTSP